MKVYEPNILTGILAPKAISNKYKYLIFMRELDVLLYAQSSFQVRRLIPQSPDKQVCRLKEKSVTVTYTFPVPWS